MADPYWFKGTPTPWKDGWDSFEVEEGDHLVQCPKCAALVRNREAAVERHKKWHALQGG